jgi:hypothetical protein
MIKEYVQVLISLWFFLFGAQPKDFFLDGLNKLEQQSHKRGGQGGMCTVYTFFQSISLLFSL